MRVSSSWFSIPVPSTKRLWNRSAQPRSRKRNIFPEACEKFAKAAKATGPENIGPERPLPGHLAQGPVLSPSRITVEKNGKIRPQPDRENAFARASGGGNATGSEPSPLSRTLILFNFKRNILNRRVFRTHLSEAKRYLVEWARYPIPVQRAIARDAVADTYSPPCRDTDQSHARAFIRRTLRPVAVASNS